ncbi:MAG TPA: hypothetical protein VF134_04770, partial [Candidatus Dormibacteraeota bacterium]
MVFGALAPDSPPIAARLGSRSMCCARLRCSQSTGASGTRITESRRRPSGRAPRVRAVAPSRYRWSVLAIGVIAQAALS